MNDRLAALVQAHVTARGLDLEDVTLFGTGSARVLRVTVDADHGVGIDTITELSRDLSTALDSDASLEELIGGKSYTLEVTSRGVDSPLVYPRHWRRNVGRLVQVELIDGERLTGRIAAVDDDEVRITVKGTDRWLDRTDITRALVQVELNRKDV